MTPSTPATWAERLSFLRLSESDLALLSQLRPALERQAPTLVAAFYRHLLSFADLRDFLADPEVRARLVEKQRAYLLSLAGPTIDEAYVRQRLRIGEAHERVGLEPRWYLGSYALYFSLLVPIIRDTFGDGSERADQARAALTKLLNFDAQLAMDAYIDRRERELEYLNDELARAGRTLARDLAKERTELRRTTQRAREAEQLASLGLLAAGLAHEIGSPMGVIQGHARLLESEAVDGNALVKDVVAFVTKRVAEIEQERGISISVIGRKNACRAIHGSPSELRETMLNLVLNAIDAMPLGGTVTVESFDRGEDSAIRPARIASRPGGPRPKM